jgi:hypothetical protein
VYLWREPLSLAKKGTLMPKKRTLVSTALKLWKLEQTEHGYLFHCKSIQGSI